MLLDSSTQLSPLRDAVAEAPLGVERPGPEGTSWMFPADASRAVHRVVPGDLDRELTEQVRAVLAGAAGKLSPSRDFRHPIAGQPFEGLDFLLVSSAAGAGRARWRSTICRRFQVHGRERPVETGSTGRRYSGGAVFDQAPGPMKRLIRCWLRVVFLERRQGFGE